MDQIERSTVAASSGYDLPVYEFVAPPELRGAAPRRYPVVIVGGGLAGLAAACDFAERGIASVVLDDDNTVGVRGLASRGIAVARKTLEAFDRLGIYPRMKEKGVTWSKGRVFSGRDELYSFDLDPDPRTRQPAFINLQQYYTEWFLVDRLREFGRTDLRWKNKVLDVRQDADAVRLDIETPAGRYTMEAEWVLACDGANSAVRKALGLDPPMEVKADRWCISDVRFKDDIPPERWVWVDAPFNEGRAVWRHLMADNVWRLDFQMAPDSDPQAVSDPEVVSRRIREMLGPGRDFELVWVGPWNYRSFALADFRAGRVFFVGDAAHLFNPLGGRGGNSGVQDAENLVWKLALVIAGTAPPALLDSYTAERCPAAHHNIRVTQRSGRFVFPETPGEKIFRHAVLSLAKRYPFARRLVDSGRLSDPFRYPGSPLTSSGGEAALNVDLALADGTRTALAHLLRGGTHFLGLYFTGEAPGMAAALATLAARSPLRCYAVGAPAAGLAEILDPKGDLADMLGARPGSVILLRPDLHVAARLPEATADAVERALDKAMAKPVDDNQIVSPRP